MSAIQVQMPTAPNFSGVNQLRLASQQNYKDAFAGLQDTLKGIQTVVRNQGTDKLLDYMAQAQTAEQFQGAGFQQGLNNLRESLGGEYNRDEYRKRADALPDLLTQRENAGIQLQQARDVMHDNPLQNQIASLMQANPNDPRIAGLVTQMHGNAMPVMQAVDGMRTSSLNRVATQHGMELGDKQFGLSQQQFKFQQQQYADQKAQQQAALAQLTQMGLTGGAGGAPASAGGVSGGKGVDQWDGLLSRIAKENNVPFNVAKAILEQESGGRAGVRSEVGATGLMQLMPATARAYVGNGDLTDPTTNITAGVKHLAMLNKQFGGDWSKATTAYFAGGGNVQKWVDAGKKSGRHWAAEMGSTGKHPKSVKYLNEVAQRMNKYKGQASDVNHNMALAGGSASKGIPYANANQVANPFTGGNTGSLEAQKAYFKDQSAVLDRLVKSNPLGQSTQPSHATLADWQSNMHKGAKGSTDRFNVPVLGGLVNFFNTAEHSADIVKVINANPDLKNASEADKVRVADALAKQFTANDGVFVNASVNDMSKRASEIVETFTAARMKQTSMDNDLQAMEAEAQRQQQLRDHLQKLAFGR